MAASASEYFSEAKKLATEGHMTLADAIAGMAAFSQHQQVLQLQAIAESLREATAHLHALTRRP